VHGHAGGRRREYVPATDFVVRRIEIFTNRGTVGLLDSDDCAGPGQVLFKRDLDTSGDVAEWRGADLDHVIAVLANHKYFVWPRTRRRLASRLLGRRLRRRAW